jgi:threonine synthase
MLSDDKGEPSSVYSCASGLDYPSVGPQHAFMFEHGRVEYTTATDQQVIDCFFELSRMEGIIPALESAHGLAHAIKIAPTLGKEINIVVNLSGRGDKDLDYVCDKYGERYQLGAELPPLPQTHTLARILSRRLTSHDELKTGWMQRKSAEKYSFLGLHRTRLARPVSCSFFP